MKNPQLTSYSNDKRLKAYPLRSGKKQSYPLILTILFNRVPEVLLRARKRGRERDRKRERKRGKNARYLDSKGGIKLTLFSGE